nr:MAG TPA: hypothetical protein [Caudoviricetes sp.]
MGGAASLISPLFFILPYKYNRKDKHPSFYIYKSLYPHWSGFFVFMRVGALCAVRERTRRVLVIFPCFSDLQTVFTDFRTRYETLF